MHLLLTCMIKCYLIASVSSAPALNLATFFAGIVMASLVEGLIPLLSALSPTEKVPKPTKEILSPSFKALVTTDTKASTAFLESVLFNPDSFEIALISSALFIIRKND